MIPRLDSSAWLWPLILLALALRLWGLQEQSYTTDEIFELHQARLPAREIVGATDGFPPLYSLSLHGWLGTLQDDRHARLLSVLFGCLAIPVMWGMSPHLGAVRSSFWPTLLLAISPLHIWYSQAARAYSLFFLVAVLSIWTCLRALKTDNRSDWLLFVIVSTLGSLTHYWFVLVPVCLGAIVLLERRSWQKLRVPLAAFSAVGLLALPIVPLARHDLGFQLAYYTSPSHFHFWELGRTYYSFIVGYSLGPSVRQVQLLSHGEALVAFVPWILLVGGCASVLAIGAVRELSGARYLARLTALVVPPVIVCGLVGNALGIGFRRPYSLWVAAPLLVVLGIGVEGLEWPRLRRLAVATLCGLCVLSLHQRTYGEEHRNQDTQALSRYLLAHESSCLPTFVVPQSGVEPLTYYLEGARSVIKLPSMRQTGTPVEAALTFLRRSTPENCRFWLVYGEPVDSDPGGILLSSLLDHGAIEKQAGFSGLDLYLGDVERLGGKSEVSGVETAGESG